jgi:hypothetical protein
LMQLKAVGQVGAQRLLLELFWRQFNNRREVGACVGLVPQPYDSSESRVDKCISKAGSGTGGCHQDPDGLKCQRTLINHRARKITSYRPQNGIEVANSSYQGSECQKQGISGLWPSGSCRPIPVAQVAKIRARERLFDPLESKVPGSAVSFAAVTRMV